jgi:Nucleotidyltransferase domain
LASERRAHEDPDGYILCFSQAVQPRCGTLDNGRGHRAPRVANRIMISHPRLLEALRSWASGRRDILAVALVGSQARGTASVGSDTDVVILATNPAEFREQNDRMRDIPWPKDMTPRSEWCDAQYGAMWSRHLTLRDGTRLELSFGRPE